MMKQLRRINRRLVFCSQTCYNLKDQECSMILHLTVKYVEDAGTWVHSLGSSSGKLPNDEALHCSLYLSSLNHPDHRGNLVARRVLRQTRIVDIKMSLDPPAYIVSLQNNIRARPISWEGAVRAKTITDADLKQIKSIDKVRKEQRKQTVSNDVDSFVKLFFGAGETQSIFQSAAKREDIIQYLLVLISDMIEGQYACRHCRPYWSRFPYPIRVTDCNHRDRALYNRSSQTSGPLQAPPSFPQAHLQPRRPHPPSHVVGHIGPYIACPGRRQQDLTTDPSCHSQAQQLSGKPRKQHRLGPAGYCRPTIQCNPPQCKDTVSLLEAAFRDRQPAD